MEKTEDQTDNYSTVSHVACYGAMNKCYGRTKLVWRILPLKHQERSQKKLKKRRSSNFPGKEIRGKTILGKMLSAEALVMCLQCIGLG